MYTYVRDRLHCFIKLLQVCTMVDNLPRRYHGGTLLISRMRNFRVDNPPPPLPLFVEFGCRLFCHIVTLNFEHSQNQILLCL